MTKPKSGGIVLDQLVRPVGTLSTAVGTLHLYRLRSSDLAGVESLPGQAPIDRIRAFLPRVSSLVEAKRFKDERPPLTSHEVERLSDAEIDRFADEYVRILSIGAPQSEASTPPKREGSEPASAFLERLLKHTADEQSRQLKSLYERMSKSTVGGLFDEVRKSSAALGSTLDAFERFSAGGKAIELPPLHFDHHHAMRDEANRRARERAEELELARLTGKMTAESAKTLKDLAEAATTLMEQMDERDEKTDRMTTRQIGIAVWSVGVSAVLALGALVVSAFAYVQDKTNNEAGDVWQRQLLDAVTESSRRRSGSEGEVQRLQSKVAELEAKLNRIEARQPPAKQSPGNGASAR